MLLGLLKPTSGKIELWTGFYNQRFSVLSRMNFSSPYVDLPKQPYIERTFRLRQALRYSASARESTRSWGNCVLNFLSIADFGSFHRTENQVSLKQWSTVLNSFFWTNLRPVLTPIRLLGSVNFDSYRRNSGATILLASHDMREVELCATKSSFFAEATSGQVPAITLGQI